MTTTLIIPCYNERARLSLEPFREALAKKPDLSLLFVDDGSTDGTGDFLSSFQVESPSRVALFRLPHNRGKAEAIRSGFLKAFEGTSSSIGYWDADLATPLDVLPLLEKVMEESSVVDIIFGARVSLCGYDIRRGLFRHYVGRTFATLADTILHLPIYDSQCGAKLFRVNDVLRRAMAYPFTNPWLIDLELVLRLRSLRQDQGLAPLERALREAPLPRWHDQPGSKVKVLSAMGALFALLRLAFAYKRGRLLAGRMH